MAPLSFPRLRLSSRSRSSNGKTPTPVGGGREGGTTSDDLCQKEAEEGEGPAAAHKETPTKSLAARAIASAATSDNIEIPLMSLPPPLSLPICATAAADNTSRDAGGGAPSMPVHQQSRLESELYLHALDGADQQQPQGQHWQQKQQSLVVHYKRSGEGSTQQRHRPMAEHPQQQQHRQYHHPQQPQDNGQHDPISLHQEPHQEHEEVAMISTQMVNDAEPIPTAPKQEAPTQQQLTLCDTKRASTPAATASRTTIVPPAIRESCTGSPRHALLPLKQAFSRARAPPTSPSEKSRLAAAARALLSPQGQSQQQQQQHAGQERGNNSRGRSSLIDQLLFRKKDKRATCAVDKVAATAAELSTVDSSRDSNSGERPDSQRQDISVVAGAGEATTPAKGRQSVPVYTSPVNGFEERPADGSGRAANEGREGNEVATWFSRRKAAKTVLSAAAQALPNEEAQSFLALRGSPERDAVITADDGQQRTTASQDRLTDVSQDKRTADASPTVSSQRMSGEEGQDTAAAYDACAASQSASNAEKESDRSTCTKTRTTCDGACGDVAEEEKPFAGPCKRDMRKRESSATVEFLCEATHPCDGGEETHIVVPRNSPTPGENFRGNAPLHWEDVDQSMAAAAPHQCMEERGFLLIDSAAEVATAGGTVLLSSDESAKSCCQTEPAVPVHESSCPDCGINKSTGEGSYHNSLIDQWESSCSGGTSVDRYGQGIHHPDSSTYDAPVSAADGSLYEEGEQWEEQHIDNVPVSSNGVSLSEGSNPFPKEYRYVDEAHPEHQFNLQQQQLGPFFPQQQQQQRGGMRTNEEHHAKGPPPEPLPLYRQQGKKYQQHQGERKGHQHHRRLEQRDHHQSLSCSKRSSTEEQLLRHTSADMSTPLSVGHNTSSPDPLFDEYGSNSSSSNSRRSHSSAGVHTPVSDILESPQGFKHSACYASEMSCTRSKDGNDGVDISESDTAPDNRESVPLSVNATPLCASHSTGGPSAVAASGAASIAAAANEEDPIDCETLAAEEAAEEMQQKVDSEQDRNTSALSLKTSNGSWGPRKESTVKRSQSNAAATPVLTQQQYVEAETPASSSVSLPPAGSNYAPQGAAASMKEIARNLSSTEAPIEERCVINVEQAAPATARSSLSVEATPHHHLLGDSGGLCVFIREVKALRRSSTDTRLLSRGEISYEEDNCLDCSGGEEPLIKRPHQPRWKDCRCYDGCSPRAPQSSRNCSTRKSSWSTKSGCSSNSNGRCNEGLKTGSSPGSGRSGADSTCRTNSGSSLGSDASSLHCTNSERDVRARSEDSSSDASGEALSSDSARSRKQSIETGDAAIVSLSSNQQHCNSRGSHSDGEKRSERHGSRRYLHRAGSDSSLQSCPELAKDSSAPIPASAIESHGAGGARRGRQQRILQQQRQHQRYDEHEQLRLSPAFQQQQAHHQWDLQQQEQQQQRQQTQPQQQPTQQQQHQTEQYQQQQKHLPEYPSLQRKSVGYSASGGGATVLPIASPRTPPRGILPTSREPESAPPPEMPVSTAEPRVAAKPRVRQKVGSLAAAPATPHASPRPQGSGLTASAAATDRRGSGLSRGENAAAALSTTEEASNNISQSLHALQHERRNMRARRRAEETAAAGSAQTPSMTSSTDNIAQAVYTGVAADGLMLTDKQHGGQHHTKPSKLPLRKATNRQLLGYKNRGSDTPATDAGSAAGGPTAITVAAADALARAAAIVAVAASGRAQPMKAVSDVSVHGVGASGFAAPFSSAASPAVGVNDAWEGTQTVRGQRSVFESETTTPCEDCCSSLEFLNYVENDDDPVVAVAVTRRGVERSNKKAAHLSKRPAGASAAGPIAAPHHRVGEASSTEGKEESVVAGAGVEVLAAVASTPPQVAGGTSVVDCRAEEPTDSVHEKDERKTSAADFLAALPTDETATGAEAAHCDRNKQVVLTHVPATGPSLVPPSSRRAKPKETVLAASVVHERRHSGPPQNEDPWNSYDNHACGGTLLPSSLSWKLLPEEKRKERTCDSKGKNTLCAFGEYWGTKRADKERLQNTGTQEDLCRPFCHSNKSAKKHPDFFGQETHEQASRAEQRGEAHIQQNESDCISAPSEEVQCTQIGATRCFLTSRTAANDNEKDVAAVNVRDWSNNIEEKKSEQTDAKEQEEKVAELIQYKAYVYKSAEEANKEALEEDEKELLERYEEKELGGSGTCQTNGDATSVVIYEADDDAAESSSACSFGSSSNSDETAGEGSRRSSHGRNECASSSISRRSSDAALCSVSSPSACRQNSRAQHSSASATAAAVVTSASGESSSSTGFLLAVTSALADASQESPPAPTAEVQCTATGRPEADIPESSKEKLEDGMAAAALTEEHTLAATTTAAGPVEHEEEDDEEGQQHQLDKEVRGHSRASTAEAESVDDSKMSRAVSAAAGKRAAVKGDPLALRREDAEEEGRETATHNTATPTASSSSAAKRQKGRNSVHGADSVASASVAAAANSSVEGCAAIDSEPHSAAAKSNTNHKAADKETQIYVYSEKPIREFWVNGVRCSRPRLLKSKSSNVASLTAAKTDTTSDSVVVYQRVPAGDEACMAESLSASQPSGASLRPCCSKGGGKGNEGYGSCKEAPASLVETSAVPPQDLPHAPVPATECTAVEVAGVSSHGERKCVVATSYKQSRGRSSPQEGTVAAVEREEQQKTSRGESAVPGESTAAGAAGAKAVSPQPEAGDSKDTLSRESTTAANLPHVEAGQSRETFQRKSMTAAAVSQIEAGGSRETSTREVVTAVEVSQRGAGKPAVLLSRETMQCSQCELVFPLDELADHLMAHALSQSPRAPWRPSKPTPVAAADTSAGRYYREDAQQQQQQEVQQQGRQRKNQRRHQYCTDAMDQSCDNRRQLSWRQQHTSAVEELPIEAEEQHQQLQQYRQQQQSVNQLLLQHPVERKTDQSPDEHEGATGSAPPHRIQSSVAVGASSSCVTGSAAAEALGEAHPLDTNNPAPVEERTRRGAAVAIEGTGGVSVEEARASSCGGSVIPKRPRSAPGCSRNNSSKKEDEGEPATPALTAAAPWDIPRRVSISNEAPSDSNQRRQQQEQLLLQSPSRTELPDPWLLSRSGGGKTTNEEEEKEEKESKKGGLSRRQTHTQPVSEAGQSDVACTAATAVAMEAPPCERKATGTEVANASSALPATAASEATEKCEAASEQPMNDAVEKAKGEHQEGGRGSGGQNYRSSGHEGGFQGLGDAAAVVTLPKVRSRSAPGRACEATEVEGGSTTQLSSCIAARYLGTKPSATVVLKVEDNSVTKKDTEGGITAEFNAGGLAATQVEPPPQDPANPGEAPEPAAAAEGITEKAETSKLEEEEETFAEKEAPERSGDTEGANETEQITHSQITTDMKRSRGEDTSNGAGDCGVSEGEAPVPASTSGYSRQGRALTLSERKTSGQGRSTFAEHGHLREDEGGKETGGDTSVAACERDGEKSCGTPPLVSEEPTSTKSSGCHSYQAVIGSAQSSASSVISMSTSSTPVFTSGRTTSRQPRTSSGGTSLSRPSRSTVMSETALLTSSVEGNFPSPEKHKQENSGTDSRHSSPSRKSLSTERTGDNVLLPSPSTSTADRREGRRSSNKSNCSSDSNVRMKSGSDRCNDLGSKSNDVRESTTAQTTAFTMNSLQSRPCRGNSLQTHTPDPLPSAAETSEMHHRSDIEGSMPVLNSHTNAASTGPSTSLEGSVTCDRDRPAWGGCGCGYVSGEKNAWHEDDAQAGEPAACSSFLACDSNNTSQLESSACGLGCHRQSCGSTSCCCPAASATITAVAAVTAPVAYIRRHQRSARELSTSGSSREGHNNSSSSSCNSSPNKSSSTSSQQNSKTWNESEEATFLESTDTRYDSNSFPSNGAGEHDDAECSETAQTTGQRSLSSHHLHGSGSSSASDSCCSCSSNHSRHAASEGHHDVDSVFDNSRGRCCHSCSPTRGGHRNHTRGSMTTNTQLRRQRETRHSSTKRSLRQLQPKKQHQLCSDVQNREKLGDYSQSESGGSRDSLQPRERTEKEEDTDDASSLCTNAIKPSSSRGSSAAAPKEISSGMPLRRRLRTPMRSQRQQCERESLHKQRTTTLEQQQRPAQQLSMQHQTAKKHQKNPLLPQKKHEQVTREQQLRQHALTLTASRKKVACKKSAVNSNRDYSTESRGSGGEPASSASSLSGRSGRSTEDIISLLPCSSSFTTRRTLITASSTTPHPRQQICSDACVLNASSYPGETTRLCAATETCMRTSDSAVTQVPSTAAAPLFFDLSPAAEEKDPSRPRAPSAASLHHQEAAAFFDSGGDADAARSVAASAARAEEEDSDPRPAAASDEALLAGPCNQSAKGPDISAADNYKTAAAASAKVGSRGGASEATAWPSLLRSRPGEQPKLPPLRRRRLTYFAADQASTAQDEETAMEAAQREPTEVAQTRRPPPYLDRVLSEEQTEGDQQAAATEEESAAVSAAEEQHEQADAESQSLTVGDTGLHDQTTALQGAGTSNGSVVAQRRSTKAKAKAKAKATPQHVGLLPCLAAAAAHRAAAAAKANSHTGGPANSAREIASARYALHSARVTPKTIAKLKEGGGGLSRKTSSSSPSSSSNSRLSSNGGLSGGSSSTSVTDSSRQQSSGSKQRHNHVLQRTSREHASLTHYQRRGGRLAQQEESRTQIQGAATLLPPPPPPPRAALTATTLPEASDERGSGTAATARFHKSHLQLRTANLTITGRGTDSTASSAASSRTTVAAPASTVRMQQQTDPSMKYKTRGLRLHVSSSRQQQLQQEQRRAKCAAAAMARAARAAAEAEGVDAQENLPVVVNKALPPTAAAPPAGGATAGGAPSTQTTAAVMRVPPLRSTRRSTEDAATSNRTGIQVLERGLPAHPIGKQVIDLTSDNSNGGYGQLHTSEGAVATAAVEVESESEGEGAGTHLQEAAVAEETHSLPVGVGSLVACAAPSASSCRITSDTADEDTSSGSTLTRLQNSSRQQAQQHRQQELPPTDEDEARIDRNATQQQQHLLNEVSTGKSDGHDAEMNSLADPHNETPATAPTPARTSGNRQRMTAAATAPRTTVDEKKYSTNSSRPSDKETPDVEAVDSPGEEMPSQDLPTVASRALLSTEEDSVSLTEEATTETGACASRRGGTTAAEAGITAETPAAAAAAVPTAPAEPVASVRLSDSGSNERMSGCGSSSTIRCVPPLRLASLHSGSAGRPRRRDISSAGVFASRSPHGGGVYGAATGQRCCNKDGDGESSGHSMAVALSGKRTCAARTPPTIPTPENEREKAGVSTIEEEASTVVSSGGASSNRTTTTALSSPPTTAATSHLAIRTARLRTSRYSSSSPPPSSTTESRTAPHAHLSNNTTGRTASGSSSTTVRPRAPTASPPGGASSRVHSGGPTGGGNSVATTGISPPGSSRQGSTIRTDTVALTNAVSSLRRSLQGAGTSNRAGTAEKTVTTTTASTGLATVLQAATSSLTSSSSSSSVVVSRQTSRGSVGTSVAAQTAAHSSSVRDSIRRNSSGSTSRHAAVSGTRSGVINRNSTCIRGDEVAAASSGGAATHRREPISSSISHSLRRGGGAVRGIQDLDRRGSSRGSLGGELPREEAGLVQQQASSSLTAQRTSSGASLGVPPSPSAAATGSSSNRGSRGSAVPSSRNSRAYGGLATTVRGTGEYAASSSSGWVPTWGQTLIDLGLVRAPVQHPFSPSARALSSRVTIGEASITASDDPVRRGGFLSARRPSTLSEAVFPYEACSSTGLSGATVSTPTTARVSIRAADGSIVTEDSRTPRTQSTTVEPPSPQHGSVALVGSATTTTGAYTRNGQRYGGRRAMYSQNSSSSSSSASSSSSSSPYIGRSTTQSRYAAPTEASEARRQAISAYQLHSGIWSRDPSSSCVYRQRGAPDSSFTSSESPLLSSTTSPSPTSPLVLDYAGTSSSLSARSSSSSTSASAAPSASTSRRSAAAAAAAALSLQSHQSQHPSFQQQSQQPHSSLDYYYTAAAAGGGGTGEIGYPAYAGEYSSAQLLQQQPHLRRQTMAAAFPSSSFTPGSRTAGVATRTGSRESPVSIAAGASAVSPSHYGAVTGGRASLPPSPVVYSNARLAAQGRGVAACLVDPSLAAAASASSSSGLYSPSSTHYQQQAPRRYSASHPLGSSRTSSSVSNNISNSSSSSATSSVARVHTACISRGGRRSMGAGILQRHHAYERGSTGGRIYLERSDGLPWTRFASHHPGRFSYHDESLQRGTDSYHLRMQQDDERRREDMLQVLIDLLPTSQFNSRRSATLSEEAKKCSICFEDYEHDDEQRRLPCTHVFHKNCIDIWLRRSLVCPMCKHDLRSAF